jgi:hypothetical protein
VAAINNIAIVASGLVMFVAMVGGLQPFRALGIILGAVVLGTAGAILDVLREMQQSHEFRQR